MEPFRFARAQLRQCLASDRWCSWSFTSTWELDTENQFITCSFAIQYKENPLNWSQDASLFQWQRRDRLLQFEWQPRFSEVLHNINVFVCNRFLETPWGQALELKEKKEITFYQNYTWYQWSWESSPSGLYIFLHFEDHSDTDLWWDPKTIATTTPTRSNTAPEPSWPTWFSGSRWRRPCSWRTPPRTFPAFIPCLDGRPVECLATARCSRTPRGRSHYLLGIVLHQPPAPPKAKWTSSCPSWRELRGLGWIDPRGLDWCLWSALQLWDPPGETRSTCSRYKGHCWNDPSYSASWRSQCGGRLCCSTWWSSGTMDPRHCSLHWRPNHPASDSSTSWSTSKMPWCTKSWFWPLHDSRWWSHFSTSTANSSSRWTLSHNWHSNDHHWWALEGHDWTTFQSDSRWFCAAWHSRQQRCRNRHRRSHIFHGQTTSNKVDKWFYFAINKLKLQLNGCSGDRLEKNCYLHPWRAGTVSTPSMAWYGWASCPSCYCLWTPAWGNWAALSCPWASNGPWTDETALYVVTTQRSVKADASTPICLAWHGDHRREQHSARHLSTQGDMVTTHYDEIDHFSTTWSWSTSSTTSGTL